jgi:CrcB protein
MPFNDALQKIILVGLGSALGGNARYWLGLWIQRRWGTSFPLGTFVVNITGAFVLGLFISFIVEKLDLQYTSKSRLFFAVGFLGSFTTFSALEYETFALTETGSFLLAAINAFGSLFVGFISVWLGMILGRMV